MQIYTYKKWSKFFLKGRGKDIYLGRFDFFEVDIKMVKSGHGKWINSSTSTFGYGTPFEE
ncbi:hypothetical protein MKW92_046130, partial [Papaver armeniacum]